MDLVVDVDGEPFGFKMKPTNKQIAKFMARDKKKRESEEGYLEVDDMLVEMLYEANPPEVGENPENYKQELGNFVLHKKVDILTEFSIAMGWTTQEKIDKAVEEEEQKAKGKLKEAESNSD